MTWRASEESESLYAIRVKQIDEAHLSRSYPYFELAFKEGSHDSNLTVWIDPKDLTRIAGLFRQASESIEALIEANRAKEIPPIRIAA